MKKSLGLLIAGSYLLNYIQVEIYYVISRFFENVSLKSLMQSLVYVLIIQNDKLCCNIILIRISMHLDMIFTLIRMHTGILWTDLEEGVSQNITVQKNTAIISWDAG